MLTIVYVLFALQLVAIASPSPAGRDAEDGVRISLGRRQDLVSDGTADPGALVEALILTLLKYANTIAAYERNTGQEPPISLGVPMNFPENSTTVKRATGSVALTNSNNVLWYGAISVGTPPVSYTVDFDTGSSDLFLPDSSCTTNCKGHKLYNPTLSTTSANRRKTFKLAYGDGSTVSGQQYTDTVSAGGLTATGQALGSAGVYSDGFAISRFPSDGLLGMGYQSISQYNSPPLFQTLISQGKTTQPVFSFKLSSAGSELFLGGVNSNLYTGAFTYAPVTTQAYWQVNMDSVVVNNRAVLGRISAVIDTGTTLIIGDATNVKRMYAQISGAKDARNTVGAGYYTVPCNSIPTIKLTFGGTPFTIAPSVFNLGRVNAKDCVGGIVSSGTSQSFWIVGDIFLRNVYSSFDLGNNRVGFATLK